MVSDDNVFVNHSMNSYVGMTKVDKYLFLDSGKANAV